MENFESYILDELSEWAFSEKEKIWAFAFALAEKCTDATNKVDWFPVNNYFFKCIDDSRFVEFRNELRSIIVDNDITVFEVIYPVVRGNGEIGAELRATIIFFVKDELYRLTTFVDSYGEFNTNYSGRISDHISIRKVQKTTKTILDYE